MNAAEFNKQAFKLLLRHYGKQHWWQDETPLEIAFGAILTQRTVWQNAEKSVNNLKNAGILTPRKILNAPDEQIAELIKPSGFPVSKTKKLKAFCEFISKNLEGSIEKLREYHVAEARELLLSVHGIGPETADTILCYALNMPVLVVDAYTFRILSRHGALDGPCSYDELQEVASQGLTPSHGTYAEYHALLVRTAKEFCKKSNPLCQIQEKKASKCPLEVLLP